MFQNFIEGRQAKRPAHRDFAWLEFAAYHDEKLFIGLMYKSQCILALKLISFVCKTAALTTALATLHSGSDIEPAKPTVADFCLYI